MIIRNSIASVEGMAAGTACFLARGSAAPEGKACTLDEAFEAERHRLEALSARGGQMGEIFAAHLEILMDPMLRETIDTHLEDGLGPAEAVHAAEEEIAAMFAEIDDEYLRARADDVRDVCRGLTDRLNGTAGDALDALPEDAVIVAGELLPSDTASMDFSRIRAFVIQKGSITSHVSIIARSKGIPALLGIDLNGIHPGDRLLVDGGKRQLTVCPGVKEEAAFHAAQKALLAEESTENLCKKDGTPVQIFGNAGSLDDIEAAISAGAEGIGLFRTEFVFMDADHLPTEDEQFEIYREAARRCKGKKLIIRTIDIGGDKDLPYLSLPKEENPFLGIRGVRLCLAYPEGFKVQVRAILRAGAEGEVLMMIPMVATAEEIDEVRKIVRSCDEELSAAGIPHRTDMPVGIMVETPAAVLMAPELAQKADFFSLGTNDLTQYTMAADRTNPKVAHLYDSLNPAVLRAIGMAVAAGKAAGIPVGICGELAAVAEGRKYLTELGIDVLSLSSPRLIRQLTQER